MEYEWSIYERPNAAVSDGVLVEIDGGTKWTANVRVSAKLDATGRDAIRIYGETLDELKERARQALESESSSVLYEDGTTPWVVLPYARGTSNIRYSWTLSFQGLEVSLHRSPLSPRIPGVRVVISAQALRMFSLRAIDERVRLLLASFGLYFQEQTYSRLDVNLTTTRKEWNVAAFSRAVEGARVITTFRSLRRDGQTSKENRVVTFGRYPGTEFQVYDKSQELRDEMTCGDDERAQRAADKLGRLTVLLGAGKYTRYELRYGRSELRNSGINSTDDVYRALASNVVFQLSHKLRVLARRPSRNNSCRTAEASWWVELREAFRDGVAALGSSQSVNVRAPEEVRKALKESPTRTSFLKQSATWLLKAVRVDSADYGSKLDVASARRLVEEYADELAAAIVSRQFRDDWRKNVTRVQQDLYTVQKYAEFLAFDDGVGEDEREDETNDDRPQPGTIRDQRSDGGSSAELVPAATSSASLYYERSASRMDEPNAFSSDEWRPSCNDEPNASSSDEWRPTCNDERPASSSDEWRPSCKPRPLIDFETWDDVVEYRGDDLRDLFPVPTPSDLLATSPAPWTSPGASRVPPPSSSSPSQPTAATKRTEEERPAPPLLEEEAPAASFRTRIDCRRRESVAERGTKPKESIDDVLERARLRTENAVESYSWVLDNAPDF